MEAEPLSGRPPVAPVRDPERPAGRVGRGHATYQASGSSSDSGRVPEPSWGHSRSKEARGVA